MKNDKSSVGGDKDKGVEKVNLGENGYQDDPTMETEGELPAWVQVLINNAIWGRHDIW